MTQQSNDLDIKHLFRVIFLQGGQVAIGTAIGAGVLLLVGIVAVFLAPIWLPIFALVYWRKECRKKAEAALTPAVVVEPETARGGEVAGGPV